MERRTSRDSVQPRSARCLGAGADGGLEVEGVGEVEVALDVHGALGGDLVEVGVEVAVLGGEQAAVLGLVGVELVAGFLDGAFELRDGAPVRDGCDVLVDEPGTVGGEGQGGLGDLAGLPHRHLTRDHALPQAREPVAGLDRVAEVPLPGTGRHPQRQCELGDAELRDQGCTLAGDRELVLGPVDHRRVEDRLDRVHDRPLDSEAGAFDLELGDLGVDLTDSVEHPGRGVDVCCRGHGSTQALTTDSQTPKTLWLPGMWTLSKVFSAPSRSSSPVGCGVSRQDFVLPQPPRRRGKPGSNVDPKPPYPVDAYRRPTTGRPATCAAGVSTRSTTESVRPPPP